MLTIDTAPAVRPDAVQPDAVDPQPVAPRRRRSRWLLLLSALVVVIGLTFVSPAGRHQWAISFIRQPSPSTSLSFRDAAALPHNVKVGAAVHLAVTVANNEGRRTNYSLVVSSANLSGANADATTVLRRTDLAVPSGGQRTTSITVRPACTVAACELTVALPGQHETIDVLLNIERHAR
jgi:hypothetical protein